MPKFERSGRFLKFFWGAVFVILVSLVQAGFLSVLPWPANYLNLVLSAAIFITFAIEYRQGLWFSFFAGLIIDLFSYLPFGSFSAILLATVIAVNALFNNFFTNKSLYSLIFLGLLGSLIYTTALLFFNFSFFIVGLPNNLDIFFAANNLLGLAWQIAFNIALLVVSFFVFNFFNKKFKKAFY